MSAQIIILFFSFFFSINFFFFLICHHLQYNTFPFRISFILLIFMPFTYSSPDPSFLLLLVKTVFLPPSWGKKWEGWVDFFAMETHECPNPYFETLQRRACTSLSTLSKSATAVNGSLTNAWKSAAYFKVVLHLPTNNIIGPSPTSFYFSMRDSMLWNPCSPVAPSVFLNPKTQSRWWTQPQTPPRRLQLWLDFCSTQRSHIAPLPLETRVQVHQGDCRRAAKPVYLEVSVQQTSCSLNAGPGHGWGHRSGEQWLIPVAAAPPRAGWWQCHERNRGKDLGPLHLFPIDVPMLFILFQKEFAIEVWGSSDISLTFLQGFL